MLSMTQFLLLLACMAGCGYTSYYIGFKNGGQIHTAVYMSIMEEFLTQKMSAEWFTNTFGKDNNRFVRFVETEFTDDLEKKND